MSSSLPLEVNLVKEPPTGAPLKPQDVIPLSQSSRDYLLADSAQFLAIACTEGSTGAGITHRMHVYSKTKSDRVVRAFQDPIVAMTFVSYHSNTGATATGVNLEVWLINPMTVTYELLAKLTISSVPANPFTNMLFFIDAKSEAPQLFVLRRHEALFLNTASRIKAGGRLPPDMSMEADAKVARRFQGQETAKGACAISHNGVFVFQVDPFSVAGFTESNLLSPEWQCCRGEAVRGLAFLDAPPASLSTSPSGGEPASLIAYSDAHLYHWKLSGSSEPQLVHRLHMGGTPIVSVLTCGPSLAVISSKQEMALIRRLPQQPQPASEELAVQRFALAVPVTQHGSTSLYLSAERCELHVVSEGLYKILPFTTFPPTAPAPLLALPSAKELIQNSQKLRDAAAVNSAAAINNQSLPAQESMSVLLTEAAQEHKTALLRGLDPVHNHLMNISEMQKLMLTQLNTGVSKLTSLALEAQMQTLQEFLKTGAIAGRATQGQPLTAAERLRSGAAPVDSEQMQSEGRAYNEYVLSLLKEGSVSMVQGVNDAIDVFETTAQKVTEASLKEALRRTQRAYIQKRFDTLMEGSSAGIAVRLQKAFHQLKEDVRKETEREKVVITQLQKDNEDLRAVIRRLTSSGILEELDSLREEVAQLRATVQQLQEGGSGVGAAPRGSNAPSLLDEALAYMEANQFTDALDRVIAMSEPALAVQFFQQISEEKYESLLTHSHSRWASIVTLLSHAGERLAVAGGSDSVAPLEKVVSWVQDMAAEHSLLDAPSGSESTSMRQALLKMCDAVERLQNKSVTEEVVTRVTADAVRDLKVCARS